MKREMLFSVIVIVCCLLAVNGYCLEDWDNLGLYGGSIEEVIIDAFDADPANHYAYIRTATPAGIYKAPLGSGGWTKLTSFPVAAGAIAIGVSEFPDPDDPDATLVFLYAPVETQIYYSTDGGASWSDQIETIFHYGEVYVVGNDNAVYTGGLVSSSTINMFKSTDGTTFTPLFSTPLDSEYSFQDISVSSDSNTIWAAIIESGTVYKWVSTGDGGTGPWTRSSYDLTTLIPGFTDFNSSAVTIDPNNTSVVYLCGQISNTAYLTKTTDGGTNWTDVSFSGATPGKLFFNSDSSIMYQGNYVSTDGGTSWSPLPQMADGNSPGNMLCIQQGNDNTLYWNTDQGLACSSDGGSTLTAINDGLEAIQIWGGIQHPTNSDILCFASKSGIGRTPDGGNTLNFTFFGTPKYSLAVNSDASFMYCGNHLGGLHISTDAGATWDNSDDNGLATLTQSELGVSDSITHKVFADPNNTNIIYAAVSTDDYTEGGIYQGTYDSGTEEWTWSRITADGSDPDTPSIPATAIHGYASGSDTVLFAGYGDKDTIESTVTGGMQISTDSGSTWTNIADFSGYDVHCIISDPRDSNIIFVSTGHTERSAYPDPTGKVFRSADGGSTWTDVTPNNSNEGAFRDIALDLTEDSTDIYAACEYKIYRSTDSGVTWQSDAYYTAENGEVFQSLFMFRGITDGASALAERAGVISQSTDDYSLVLGSQTGLYLWGISTEWYFAEGCTSGDFDTWLLIANPQAATATVTVTYYKPDSSTQASYTVDPTSRYSIHVDKVEGHDSTDVSLKISSNQSIVCERAMYWQSMTKGHDTIGATAPSTRWYFGEGCTNGFDTWILLMNPSTTNQANVALTFMKGDGTTVIQNEIVAASRRHSVNVGSLTGMADVEFSTLVESDIPIVSERAMYWNDMKGGHCSGGTNSPSNTWYLAEGYTGGTYDTWVLIQNPGSSSATCTVTYYINNGDPQTETITVGANSRYSIHVDSTLADHEVSTYINAGDDQVIAERAMYWGEGDNADGHCTMGSKALSTSWFLAEGCTAGDFDEYILLMNPSTTEATVSVTYLKTDGTTVAGSYTVSGQSRYTINPDGISGLESASFSASITSTIPIAVERAMYIGTTGGHCSRGMRQ